MTWTVTYQQLRLTLKYRQLADILALEQSLTLPHFTADDAFSIGMHIRERLRELSQQPAVVNVTLANSNNLVFHAWSRSGVLPDNDQWLARKRKTVLRWGVSSWYMGNKLGGKEDVFRDKYMLGEAAGEYAIHGGAVPVRVKGVEGVIAVIVVSGLKQDEDHMVVVEALQHFLQTQTNQPVE
jgi:uncharacterized protein (UPF0303 family)